MGNLWVNPNYSETNGCSACSYENDIHGYNFTGIGSYDGNPSGGIPTDIQGHGTHVSGIVGAVGNNIIGVSGVNWNVSLAWLGIDYDGEGHLSTIAAIEALNYANNHDIFITNNSYGSTRYSSIFEYAISNYNGLFIVAAGNEGSNNDTNKLFMTKIYIKNI